MAAMDTPICDFGWTPPDFSLTGIDGKPYTLADARGPNGALVMFICNHCPYVRAIAGPLARDVAGLRDAGIGALAVMPNDTTVSPGDSFDKMKDFAAQNGFAFPYVIDETQDVARAYGAVCTPDFFGFNADMALQYRGRFDASGRDPATADTPKELFDAMILIAETGRGPERQNPSVGCSIKWRT